MGMHLGIGITIGFAYVLLGKMGMAFGVNGVLSPVWGAWIPNILYALMAIVFLAKAPK